MSKESDVNSKIENKFHELNEIIEKNSTLSNIAVKDIDVM